MPGLFDPLAIRDLTFANPIRLSLRAGWVFVSPMCQYSSDDGYANDWHFVHLGSRAIDGAGLRQRVIHRAVQGLEKRE